MNVKQRSFWSTTAGVATGLAGVLTALVGLLTVSVQLGWLSSGGSKPGADAGTTTSSSPTSTRPFAGTNPTTGAGTPQFDVSPTSVTFDKLGPRKADVTMRNTGTIPLFLQPPLVSGPDASQFSATNGDCSTRLDAGRSCDLAVEFKPSRAGDYTARLVIQVTGTPAREIPLKGSALLA